MKRSLLLIILIPFLYSCGAGGGGGSAVNSTGGGDNGSGNKPNPSCSGNSNVAEIKIKKDGIYKIAYSSLCNAGINLSGTAITALKIENQGREIAIDIADSNYNGIFDDGDYVEFYGKAIPRSDSRFRYTETNIYWLSAEEGIRKRIEEIPDDPYAQRVSSSFLKVLHEEKDTWYVQENYPEIASPGEVREHWYWGERFYSGDIWDDYFSVSYLDKDQPVFITLHLQPIKPKNNILHIKIYINNNLIVDRTWDSSYDLAEQVSTYYLLSGPNKLRVESLGDPFYLDWFEVRYYHKYQAVYDEIEFTGKGIIELSYFTSPDINIYEISDPTNVRKTVRIGEWTQSSGYKASIPVPQDSEGKFLALTPLKKKGPLSIEPYIPSGIDSISDYDYIIITHEDFYDAIRPLADYRVGQGYKVYTAKVKDIYDEFGYGLETPLAIKEFLTGAYNKWTTKPRFVLLVGDGTVDYKDISGYGESNGVKSYVPAYLYNYRGLGEVPSDNWFVDVVNNPSDPNDTLPEMNIGRIPAKSPADVTAVINKIISHEKSLNKSNNILLLADYDPLSGNIFESLSESLSGIVPTPEYSILRQYYKDYYPDADSFRSTVKSIIDSGSLIVNYTGHGSVVDWGNDNIFSSNDVAGLNNNKYPLVVALNCLNGYFVLADDGVEYKNDQGQVVYRRYPSIAESFLLAPGKGAVAALAASAIGYPSEHDPLAQKLYGIVFGQDIPLGEAVTKAKEAAYKNGDIMEDVVQTFIFFGDPATRLK